MYKTIEQIEKEYDGQWILMVNCQKDKLNSIAGGEVVFHDKSMNEVLSNMKLYKEKGFSAYVRYIGVLPEGVALVL